MSIVQDCENWNNKRYSDIYRLIRLWRFIRESPPFHATFWEHLQRWALYTGLVYKLGCEAAMNVKDNDTLKGAHSFVALFQEISLHFLGTLTEMGSIYWVGVQTWL